MDLHPVPGGREAADAQDHDAVGRADGVSQQRRAGQAVRRADVVRGGPDLEGIPRRHRRRRNHDGRRGVALDNRRRRLDGWGLDRLGRCVGERPVQRRGLAGLVGCRATRQKNRPGKNDSRNSKHAAIVRNRKRDSSCFDLRVAIGDGCDPGGSATRCQPQIFCCACRKRFGTSSFCALRILVAITGASGALYAQRLLDNLDPREHEIHVVQSRYAEQVIAGELPGGLRPPAEAKLHNLKSMNAPFASGSNPPDAMVVIPCTMGTMGRIAHGYSEDVLLRAADVVLKEGRKLILVPRETPLSLVHVKNMELLLLAGATILPANPGFYSHPKTVQEVADTVVARVLDHLGVPNQLAPRWAEEKE
ncbi:MAG: UbiX family flavin prenyltransferase [Verrucomicrobiota bacterium]|nr:UbiX family flavin prenyltransferase [Verrucomicrobiota bacterium]